MQAKPRFQDRRNSSRLKMVSPVVYTQFDKKGRVGEHKACKSINISSRGVKLKSIFPVDFGEMLEITMTLGPTMVTFKGRVVYVTSSRDQGFEFGICIKEIEAHDRIALTRFVIQKCREREFEPVVFPTRRREGGPETR